jgi:hypothetical protein
MLYFGDEESGDPVGALHGEAKRINAILAEPTHAKEMPAGFAPTQCGGAGDLRMCLYRRAGGCDPSVSRYAIERSLGRIAL